jgi:ketosteroid isomerase-like protein
VAEHPNARLIKRLHKALAHGDYVPRVSELFSEHVVWHLPGGGPLSGEHEGRDAVLTAMQEFERLSEGTIRIDVHDILASDEHAVALLRATGSRGNKRYDSLEIDVYHISNGRVTEFWSFAEDQRLTDEFWS